MYVIKETIKYYAGKVVKVLLIALPINLLAGLIYCLLAKKMSILVYSNVLAIIGGAYLAIGGMSSMGGMFSETSYTKNFSRNVNQVKADNSSRSNFNIIVLLTGVTTMLLSFAVLVFQ